VNPYYQQDGVTIYHGDCREVLPQIEASTVSAIVADPPYFRVKSEAWDRQWKDAGRFLDWLGSVADEWRRVMAGNGSVYCFASSDMGDRVAGVIGSRFNVLNRVRWIKEQGWHQKAERATLRSFLTPWEEIIFAEHACADADASKQAGYDEAARLLHQRVYAPIGAVVAGKRQAAGLQRWEVDVACAPSKKPTGLCYRWEEGACLPTLEQFVALCRLCGDEREYEGLRREYEGLRREYEGLRREYEGLRREYEGLRRPFFIADNDQASDIWRFPTVSPFAGKHPCEKPLSLLSYMIQTSTRPKDIVLDSFIGSGSTLEAARNLGRRAIGIEREERYCEIAAERLSQSDIFAAVVAGDDTPAVLPSSGGLFSESNTETDGQTL
jgi:adenine-specific DNA-methyltransferase